VGGEDRALAMIDEVEGASQGVEAAREERDACRIGPVDGFDQAKVELPFGSSLPESERPGVVSCELEELHERGRRSGPARGILDGYVQFEVPSPALREGITR
jgi:hypothetical protein